MSSKALYLAVTVAYPVSPTLLRDLVTRVCAVCGVPQCSAELTRHLAAAVERLEDRGSGGDYELRFHAKNGALDVAVSDGTQQLWQISRPID